MLGTLDGVQTFDSRSAAWRFQPVAQLGRSAAYRVAERYHPLIVGHVGRGDGVVLVPASDGNQHMTSREPLDELSCRLDISSCWYGEDYRIWLVSLHRYEPVPHRKIWSEMENRHPSPPGRRSVCEDAELMMAAGGQSG